MGTALALLLLSQAAPPPAEPRTPPSLELRGGLWFDGTTFREDGFYVVDGRLTRERPAHVDRTLDLADGFVVPPFGEAHNHNVQDGAEDTLAAYLKAGIFYVKNPNSLPRTTTTVRALVNRPDGVDVVFAGGGLTASGGHPVEIAVFGRDFRDGDGQGGFYFAIDDRAALERSWPEVLAQPRDFLKTYLLYSEEYASRRDDPKAFGWRGLDPELLPEIVRRAHEAGLRVSTHIETATDFHHAVRAGVDEVNHMSGFRPNEEHALETYAIADEDARLAGEHHTFVVTTLGELLRSLESAAGTARARADAILALHRQNFERLRKSGVRIAIGSDDYRGNSVAEALAIARAGLMEPDELLRAWCQDTAETIFPARKLGRLEEGYEASFLVLGGDPLEDLDHVRDIRLRVKQGHVLAIDR
jgi:cytosine/adenosine deaminase-related metal-dependent hydrolase